MTSFLTACSGNDEDVSYYSEADLIGKWYKQSGNIPQCEKNFIEFTTTHGYLIINYVLAPTGNEWYCFPNEVKLGIYGQGWKLNGNSIEIYLGKDTPGPAEVHSTMEIVMLTPDMIQLKDKDGVVSTYTAN